MFDPRQAVAAFLTIGMCVALFNMIRHDPFGEFKSNASQESAPLASIAEEGTIEKTPDKIVKVSVEDSTPKPLWGKPGPKLQPCWNTHITGRQGKSWGYIQVQLSNGPQYHQMQVADAVVVARHLKATLMLPTIKEAAHEPNGGFDKIYDVNHFISSLKDVVRVVGRLPEDLRVVAPKVVKVPYKMTPEYIEENVRSIFKKNVIIQLVTVFTPASLKVRDSSTDEVQAIRCQAIYDALKFHSQVQKLGDRIINRVKDSTPSSSKHFIAVDLRVDVLDQKGCSSGGTSKHKKCFDGDDIGSFLKRLGFSSSTPIYLTQSRWDPRLDGLKDMYPNIYTKDHSMPANEEKQLVYTGKTQFEKAIDFYICIQSDVFVPAISGISYVSIAGERIKFGKTQILVPMTSEEEKSPAQLKVPAVLSRFITKKDHAVYSCFCKASAASSK